jgi:hypothetical protein
LNVCYASANENEGLKQPNRRDLQDAPDWGSCPGNRIPTAPFVGGYHWGHLPLAGSMSAYYHASDSLHPTQGSPGKGVMRDEFVGILFAVGVILFVYQGYTRLEDWALNLAGILAWGIALFPMAWPSGASNSSFSLHGTCAISFFICIAYVCIFRASDTLALIHNKTLYRAYRRTYICLGIAMVALPAFAFFLISQLPWHTSAIFFVELAGIYVFATYWIVKSHEVSKTDSDRKAAMGKLRIEPHGVSAALRLQPLSITSVDDSDTGH